MKVAAIIGSKIKKVFRTITDAKISVYAASLTYYVFLGLIPYAFVAFRIFAALGLSADGEFPLDGFFAGETLKGIINATNAAKAGESVISFLITFYSSTSAFYKLKKLSADFGGETNDKNFILTRVLSAFVMLIVQAIFVASAVIGIAASHILKTNEYKALTIFTAIICVYFALVVVNRFVSGNGKMNAIFLASLVVLALWSVFTVLFYIYITFFTDFSKLYGTFSAIIVFFIWLYLLMSGLVTGVIVCEKLSVGIIAEKRT